MKTKIVILPISLTVALLMFSSIVVPRVYCDNPRETPVVKVVRENAEAVVNISTEHIILLRENPAWGQYGSEFDFWFDQFFGQSGRMRALKLKSVGSGVIVDKEGMIITNAHVVHMASNIFVILSDGTSVQGKVVYENPADDLALIKIDSPKPLKAVTLGREDDILIGETVVAIGNPLGLENSVTVGIISGKEREIYSSRGEKVSDELIQIDAPINPGNSGGALLNLLGELVGINVAVVQNSQSIGFAVPIKKVKEAIDARQRSQPLAIKHRARPAPPSAVSSAQPQGQGWDPFSEMEQMRKEMDEMFRGIWGRRDKTDKGGMFNTDIFYDTSLDMKETDEGYEIKLDVSDLNKEKIDINVNDSSLTISGQGSDTEEETSPQSLYRSRRFHSFLRTIPLPADADSESVATDIKGDTLMIRLRKK